MRMLGKFLHMNSPVKTLINLRLARLVLEREQTRDQAKSTSFKLYL